MNGQTDLAVLAGRDDHADRVAFDSVGACWMFSTGPSRCFSPSLGRRLSIG